MLTADDKKEYMAIMHEFSALRSELESLLHPVPNDTNYEPANSADTAASQLTTVATDSNVQSESGVTVDEVATTPLQAADEQRLEELRKKLNL